MNIKKLTALLLCSAALAAMAGCEIKINSESSKESSVITESSEISAGKSEESSENAVSSAPESSAESSTGESSETVAESQNESSTESSVESTEESSNEVSFESMTESEAAEVSIEGYQFDDEQIVKDYHTAKEFTDNEEFNKIFSSNALDLEYMTELRTAEAINQMRSVTITYSDKWNQKADEVYNALYDALADNPSEREKLEQSQTNWKNGLSEIESSFTAEAQNGGTEAFLAADAAMMNYYKGRAAVLLEQIYELNGNIELSAYGL